MARWTLGELAARIDGQLDGANPTIPVVGLATLTGATSGQISFYTNRRYHSDLKRTRAAAVILAPSDRAHCPVPAVLCADPHLGYARASQCFAPCSGERLSGIHSSAVVSDKTRIGAQVWIAAQAVIEDGAVIGDHCHIGPGCIIERNAHLGSSCHLHARVCIGHDVQLGHRVVVHPGAVIGAEGFGFARDRHAWQSIAHLGSVEIGDDVEIGANTTIDRGTLENTVLEAGVRLDNLVQVAHNVRIGANSVLAGCVGVAGSAQIGRECLIGGGVGIAGHLQIADGSRITGMTLVSRSLNTSGTYSSGLPAQPNRLWNRAVARLRQIDILFRRLEQLERHDGTDQRSAKKKRARS